MSTDGSKKALFNRRIVHVRAGSACLGHASDVWWDNACALPPPGTTRRPRDGEISGVDYNFVSIEEFFSLEESGALLESGKFKGEDDCSSPSDPSPSPAPKWPLLFYYM